MNEVRIEVAAPCLVLSGATGVAHPAAALRVPSVVLFDGLSETTVDDVPAAA